MMTINLFVIANIKQLRTDGSFRIVLPFFRTSWSVGVLIQQFLTVFTIWLSLARFWRAFGISGGRGLTPPPPGTPLCTRILFHLISVALVSARWTYHWSAVLQRAHQSFGIWRTGRADRILVCSLLLRIKQWRQDNKKLQAGLMKACFLL